MSAAASDSKLLTKAEVADLLGVKKGTVDLYRRNPLFPRPVMLSTRAPRWRLQDVAGFIESLAAASPASK